MQSLVSLIIILIVFGVGFVFFNDSSSVTDLQNPQEINQGFSPISGLVFEDLNGNRVSLEEVTANKPTVINTWATWCPFCTKELADFEELHRRNPDTIVIAINRSESRQKNISYINESSLGSIIYLLDPNDTFYKSIGGFSMPETIFINSDGSIGIHKRGPMDIEEMEALLSNIK